MALKVPKRKPLCVRWSYRAAPSGRNISGFRRSIVASRASATTVSPEHRAKSSHSWMTTPYPSQRTSKKFTVPLGGIRKPGAWAGTSLVPAGGEWTRPADSRWAYFVAASGKGVKTTDGVCENFSASTQVPPPGWMPRSGHGRPVTFLPPDGNDHVVEFMFGGASAWRREVVDRHKFSTFFQGYGLYEDLSFSLQVSRTAPLYVCTAARLVHRHDTNGRPNPFRHGRMVVRNGWYVWRQRWPHPSTKHRFQWWSITLLLMLCRVVDPREGHRWQAFQEALGRLAGVFSLPMRETLSGNRGPSLWAHR